MSRHVPWLRWSASTSAGSMSFAEPIRLHEQRSGDCEADDSGQSFQRGQSRLRAGA